MMRRDSLYINGEWVEANGDGVIEVVNQRLKKRSVPFLLAANQMLMQQLLRSRCVSAGLQVQ